MAATPDTNLGFQNFFQATLTGDITASSTDILMDSIPNASQGFLVIEPDSSTNREVIFYTSKTALKVVCPSAADGRGQDDTTAVAHSTGATVIMAPVAAFFEALQNGRAVSNAFGGAQLGAIHYYTYDGTDIFVDGVDQNNAANTINWTKPTGLKYVIVEVQGGGGAGGGTAATNGSTYAVGGGGGAGCYARKKIAAGDLGSTETVTVGARGAGASGAGGGNGGNSSFGAHCTGNGGSGGSTGTCPNTNGATINGGAGSSTGTGDIVIAGQPGSWGFAQVSNNNVGGGGQGGPSVLGHGGRGQAANTTGEAASGYGAGGGGGCRAASQSAAAGGNGSAGTVVVYEFY